MSSYQNGRYTQALSLLKQARSGDFDPVEKTYYEGLCHFKLRELKPAEEKLAAVPDSSPLSPSALFLLGVVRFQSENYEAAKKDFEKVIDTSQDPQLDRQSESYLEQIANIQNFQELQKKPWSFNLAAGLMYDSNILSVATNTGTDQAGYRLNLSGSLDRRLLLSEKRELSIRFALNEMNSLTNQKFVYSDSLQSYDPLVSTLSAPIKWRTQAWKTPLQIGISPFYETIHMDVDGNESTETLTKYYALRKREMILSSWGTRIESTWIFGANWFSTPTYEIRRDNSLISSSAEEDQKAWKHTVGWANTLFINDKKTKGHVFDLKYTLNQALGQNQSSQRSEGLYTWLSPLGKASSYSFQLGYASTNFPLNSSNRKDGQTNLGANLRYPLSKKLYWSNTAQYLMSSSNVETYKYNKFSLLTSIEWSGIF